MDMDKNDMWEYLLEHGIATEAELQLATDILPWEETTMLAVLYARTGYRNFDQAKEEFGE